MNSGAAMREIVHPGSPSAWRSMSVPVRVSGIARVTVNPGEDLFAAVHAALAARDAPGGAFVLVDGNLSRIALMTGGPGGGDGLPMGFHGPHVLDAPLEIVAGAGGCGIDEQGARFSHCHAAFGDAGGRLVGGHLLPGETIAGERGIAVDLMPLADARFARRFDPETHFTIFHPEAT